jgi:hypothetical protein
MKMHSCPSLLIESTSTAHLRRACRRAIRNGVLLRRGTHPSGSTNHGYRNKRTNAKKNPARKPQAGAPKRCVGTNLRRFGPTYCTNVTMLCAGSV